MICWKEDDYATPAYDDDYAGTLKLFMLVWLLLIILLLLVGGYAVLLLNDSGDGTMLK